MLLPVAPVLRLGVKGDCPALLERRGKPRNGFSFGSSNRSPPLGPICEKSRSAITSLPGTTGRHFDGEGERGSAADANGFHCVGEGAIGGEGAREGLDKGDDSGECGQGLEGLNKWDIIFDMGINSEIGDCVGLQNASCFHTCYTRLEETSWLLWFLLGNSDKQELR